MKDIEYLMIIFGSIIGITEITLGMNSSNNKETLFLTLAGFTSFIISYSAFGFYYLYTKINNKN